MLLRIYGVGTEAFFDRENEHIIFRKFSDAKIGFFLLLCDIYVEGPFLHGMFDGGRIEEFLELHSLTSQDLPSVIVPVSQQLAVLHNLDILELAHKPSLFDSLRNWYQSARQITFGT